MKFYSSFLLGIFIGSLFTFSFFYDRIETINAKCEYDILISKINEQIAYYKGFELGERYGRIITENE